jgi:hypothetical protein
MRPQPIILHLGGQDFSVRPLTLAQVQRIEPLLANEAQRPGASITVASEIVAISLERDHPHAAGKLSEMETTAPEIARAMRAVLRLAGFIAAETAEPPVGEGPAGADLISA